MGTKYSWKDCYINIIWTDFGYKLVYSQLTTTHYVSPNKIIYVCFKSHNLFNESCDFFKSEFDSALLSMKITILMWKRKNSLFGLAFVEYHVFNNAQNWRFKIGAHPNVFENSTFMRLRITIFSTSKLLIWPQKLLID